MDQTRAQAVGAQDRHASPEDKGKQQDVSMRESLRQETHQGSSQDPVEVAQGEDRKRAVEDSRDSGPEPSPSKRPRLSRPLAAENTSDEAAADSGDLNEAVGAVGFWAREGYWPREYVDNPYVHPGMEHALARKKSLSSLRRKRSDSAMSASAPSDQQSREEKSAQYRDPRYKILLSTKGSFMDPSDLGITDASKQTCYALLGTEQAAPNQSLFQDGLFTQICRSVEDRNEARVLRDISPLIVPSAEILAMSGSTGLKYLIESTNEGWNNSIPLTKPRPQPDYSVGFRREAFTDEQLAKLLPFIGDFIAGDRSFFMATYYMYFPFLACEVKCGTVGLDTADRQNAHSMTLAARGTVELFRLVNREDEVHRQILAFSVSHDHQSVRIFGYYPVIDGKDTKYYRHPIRSFCFTELDGKERWAAYQFTKNIYDTWMPTHFKRLCSAIDQLPDLDIPTLSESTGLSKALQSHHLESSADSESLHAGGDDQTDTSFSKPGPVKRRRSPVKK